MGFGPVEVVIVACPGNQFNGDVLPSLIELVEQGTIRVVDIAILTKDAAGNVAAMEIADLAPEAAAPFLSLVDETQGIFADEDFAVFGEQLSANSTAACIIFENTWAARFVDAVHGSNGVGVINERIPRAVVEALEEAL
ncbi:MAG: DUF6325 family protein [Chloroflexota bacterium]